MERQEMNVNEYSFNLFVKYGQNMYFTSRYIEHEY